MLNKNKFLLSSAIALGVVCAHSTPVLAMDPLHPPEAYPGQSDAIKSRLTAGNIKSAPVEVVIQLTENLGYDRSDKKPSTIAEELSSAKSVLGLPADTTLLDFVGTTAALNLDGDIHEDIGSVTDALTGVAADPIAKKVNDLAKATGGAATDHLHTRIGAPVGLVDHEDTPVANTSTVLQKIARTGGSVSINADLKFLLEAINGILQGATYQSGDVPDAPTLQGILTSLASVEPGHTITTAGGGGG